MIHFNPSQKLSILCFFIFSHFAVGQIVPDYNRFIDSSDTYIDKDTKKAMSFLNSIPSPIDKHIKGRVADYYLLKSIIHDEYNESIKYQQCTITAIKYAEIEKNYCVGGEACIGLFSSLYLTEKDTTALKYLDKAKVFYKKCDYAYGNLDVQQVEAYVKFLDGDYVSCNNMLLSNLKAYENVKEDTYYKLFALYMLTSNYIYLNDFNKAYEYFDALKRLKSNPSTIKFNYFSFEGSIHTSFAEAYLKKEQIDSTHFYLEQASKTKNYLTISRLKDYFEINANLYSYKSEVEKSKVYIDSLIILQDQMFDKTIEASLETNESLAKAESKLLKASNNKMFTILLLGFIGVASLLTYFLYNKEQNNMLNAFQQEVNSSLSYLKSNNEQLTIKVHGLEEYIKNLKVDIKRISRIDSIENQKEKIKELYKNLHINSSTILDKSESHLELVNDLNIEFFKKLKENYHQLNKSEIIICYYIFMEFSNKEIAVFLNSTIRSVESRRYRISKKIGVAKKDVTLLEYLKNNYSHTLKKHTV